MYFRWKIILAALFISGPGWAHDPIFAIGPHVLFKGGVEVATETYFQERGDERATELRLGLAYGLTGDWAAGIELPYAFKEAGSDKSDGPGDLRLFTKYRFWRHDTLGAQESAAAFLKVKFDTVDEDESPTLGTGTTDAILGLTYGYEGRKWYRWTSLRYRFNDRNDAGLERGDKVLVDLAGGIRLRQTDYLQPDTVWLLELNGEYDQQAEINGVTLRNTGGTEWFLSPGIFWTMRNFAIKAGAQIPIYSHLDGNQAETDFRVKVVFEWHL